MWSALSRNSTSKQLSGACFRASSLVFSPQQKSQKSNECTALQTPQGSAFLWEACGWCVTRLQNFFTHIRKLPHFDTRFGVAQARFMPLQKPAFSKCPGRSVAAFLLSRQMCPKDQFSASKRVSKWGNFLISINFFCKQ